MESKTVEVKALGESYFEIKHKTGLKIVVYPLLNYETSYAMFGTKYGSADSQFVDKTGKLVQTPEGIAHFLEHKMFENEDGTDVFEQFAKTGASVNAFTTFEKTAYFFSGAGELKQNLKILLSFVMRPYFTDETVKKEQGIIGQEIGMYNDDPHWQAYFRALGAIYSKHPVGNDIAGTVESIAEITPELLYTCYNNFYSLNNMILVVAGNVDKAKVLAVVDEVCETLGEDGSRGLQVKPFYGEEPKEVFCPEVRRVLPVATPIVEIGFKEETQDLGGNFKRQLSYAIALDMLFGETSRFYEENYKSGLITEPLGLDVLWGNGYFATFISAETTKPRDLYGKVLEELERSRGEGLDEESFELSKKSLLSQYIEHTEKLDLISTLLFDIIRAGINLDEVFDYVKSLELEDIKKILAEGFKKERSVLSVVEPG